MGSFERGQEKKFAYLTNIMAEMFEVVPLIFLDESCSTPNW